MIYYSVELYHADFMLWYDNLSAPDPYYVLPVLMGVTMFAQQKMSSQSMGSQNQQAAVMMKVMPVVFTAFMLFLPAGLVLYYAISLIIGVGQQYYIKRKFSTQEA
jgi:YidC/Oxa1 family membrane protein insertase